VARFHLFLIFLVVMSLVFALFVTVERFMKPTPAPTNPREWQDTAPRG
jgi:hypothetical protein